MAAPPPRPSARNAGAPRAGPGGAGAPRPAAGSAASTSGGKEKPQGTFFLGRYRVVEEIGIGGMASVHLARMDGPGGFQKWVAIKRIHPNLVEDDQFVDMFLDEARIAAGINHANVAQVFDLGKDEGTYWIAMEYLHGEPLREVMRRCEERRHLISPDIAARICADAAEGLHAAHELRGKSGQLLGLVHRDVTPHNLFVTYEGYTKVVDFGIAKVADRLSETRAGTLKGKLAYMSPEQVRGQDDVDRTTDVFALGVVLWELTTGHRLFRMDTDLDTLEKVQACVVPPPSSVISGYPIELESVVMKALAKRKVDRFQSAREFSRALNMYLQRRGVLIDPEEVSAFVRSLFADRIQQREAHLAWAADVTSTINIDQLNAMKAANTGGRKAPSNDDDISLKSLPSATNGPATLAVADHGRPSVPGAPTVGVRPPSTNGTHRPPPNLPAGPPPPPPPTVPHSPAALSSQPAAGQQQQPNFGPPKTKLATTSLVDDDEDIPTTVATREHVKDLVSQPGMMQQPTPGPGKQPQLSSIRATSMGLAPAQVAMAQQGRGGPTFGPPPSSQQPQHGQAPGFGPPPGFGGGHTMALPPSSNPGFAAAMNAGAMTPNPGGAQQGPSAVPGFGPPPSTNNGQGQHGQGQQHGQHGQGQQHAQQQHAQQGQIAQQGPFQANVGAGYNNGNPNYSGSFAGPPPNFASQQAPQLGQGQQGGQQAPNSAPKPVRQSQVETALSLQRPDPAAMWMAQQASSSSTKSGDSMSTMVLVAVAVLTAICVLALGALIYFKRRSPTGELDQLVPRVVLVASVSHAPPPDRS